MLFPPRSRSLVVVACLGSCLAVVTGGCATTDAGVGWEDAVRAPPTAPPGARTHSAKSDVKPHGAHHPTATTAPAHDRRSRPEDAFGGPNAGEGGTLATSGMLIDRALTEFRSHRVADRKAGRSRRSAVHAARWLRVLSEVDDATTLQPMADDLGAFVRARVTLEVEFQSDLERRRKLPRDLKDRVNETLSGVDARVAELRLVAPPGSLGPAYGVDGSEVLVLRSPVTPMLITSPFGVRTDPIHGRERFHAGVDFGAPQGTMVYSASGGVVIYANWQGGYGRHVVIDHGGGIRTHYSHLDELFVSSGETVKSGDTIGSVGQTGRATGPHLHFSVTNHEGQFLDPQQLLERVVARENLADLRGQSRRSFRKVASSTTSKAKKARASKRYKKKSRSKKKRSLKSKSKRRKKSKRAKKRRSKRTKTASK